MREVNFEKLTKRAIALYAKERAALVGGDTVALANIEALKAALLKDIDTAEGMIGSATTSRESETGRMQLKSLQGIIARRMSENKQLARANGSTDGVHWHVA